MGNRCEIEQGKEIPTFFMDFSSCSQLHRSANSARSMINAKAPKKQAVWQEEPVAIGNTKPLNEIMTPSARHCFSGIIPYVGIWHRTSDMMYMGEIRTNGTLTWSSNFRISAGASNITNIDVKRIEGGGSRLEISLGGSAHIAELAQHGRTVSLLWSDGEMWIRGFEPYVGFWYRKVDGQYCANLLPDGRLIWNVEPQEEIQLGLSPSGRLMMKQGKSYHLASLVSESIDFPNCTKELLWDDGDAWLHRLTGPNEVH